MRQQSWWLCVALGSLIAGVSQARAEVLTADQAVQIALLHNTQIVQAEAGLLDARSSVYGAYSGVLPRITAEASRSGSKTQGRGGSQLFGNVATPNTVTDNESFNTLPTIRGSWAILDLGALEGLRSAKSGRKGAELRQKSTRQDVAFDTRQQFYAVVTAVRLALVAESALQLARDDERRVRALFEVGSVSRSDLLKAQVRTSQSQLDSLRLSQAVVNQRITLAEVLGVAEETMGEVDTNMTARTVDVDEVALRSEAMAARPDLAAADAELNSAKKGLRAMNLSRLPFLSLGANFDYMPKSNFKQKTYGTAPLFAAGPDSVLATPGPVVKSVVGSVTDPITTGNSTIDHTWGGSIALTWNIFTGMETESRIAAAQARLRRAEDARNSLYRNLDAEVHQAVQRYSQASVQDGVARQSVESATENLKLTQQKYNVGSATILDLIDAQVQLQRAQSDAVLALAAINVAEAQLNRARGKSE